ncbi:hypothetical protein PHSC3_000177 [Chlamydiales bacterium STE3]|nr:hypothetical protein PHSC3_000177 [Chlamydiales bacterium STE3]
MNLAFFIFAFALAGFLISSAAAYLFAINLLRRRREVQKKILNLLREKGFFQTLFNSFNLKEEIGQLSDEKLDRLVSNFKAKVPMVAMFLGGDLEVTLKQLAKEELLSMVPEIEKSLIQQLRDQDRIYNSLENQMTYLPMEDFRPTFISLLLPSLVLGSLLGALFGIVFFLYLGPN